MDSEKTIKQHSGDGSTSPPPSLIAGTISSLPGEGNVFNSDAGTVNFRNVSWQRAAVFMLKMTFATGVLFLPASLNSLGAVPGAISIVFWGLVNMYMAVIQGEFKIRHPSLHTVADGAGITASQMSGGSKRLAFLAKEVTEVVYLISWILCSGLSIRGTSIALNAVSHHATCTVVFAFASYVTIAAVGTIRTSPAAALLTGSYDLGFRALPSASTTFAQAWSASLVIFASSANTSGYVPVISEMRNPQHYFRSVYITMIWIIISYVVIRMVMFRFAGQWLATPALGSAVPTIKIISYAVALSGLVASGMICVHVSGKSVFVRVLRGSKHLTANTWQHWTVWLASTFGTGLVGWVICEAIPVYGSLVSIIGSLGFGPLGICLPAIMWFCMHPGYRQGGLQKRLLWFLHIAILMMGLSVTVGGTYANIVVIIGQFRDGAVSGPFDCADNSNTVG